MSKGKPAAAEFKAFSSEYDHILPLGWPLQRDQIAQKHTNKNGVGSDATLLSCIQQSSVGRWLEAERGFVDAKKAFKRTRFYLSCSKTNRLFALARFMIDVGCELGTNQSEKRGPVKIEALREAEMSAKALLGAIDRGVEFPSFAATRDLYWRLVSYQETCEGYLNGTIPRPAPGRDDGTLGLRWVAMRLARRFNRSFHSCMPQVVHRVLEIDSPGCVSEKMVRKVCSNNQNGVMNTPGYIRLPEGQPLKRVRK